MKDFNGADAILADERFLSDLPADQRLTLKRSVSNAREQEQRRIEFQKTLGAGTESYTGR